MRMKRPQGYKHIPCPHGSKIRLLFRTLHRMKIEADYPPCCQKEMSGTHTIFLEEKAEEGG